jgi:succinate dehydrogenase/fumarate reductase-like Fe-S protein
MDVTIKILRYNPEVSEDAKWESYQVTAEGTDRVLDALHKVKWDLDGSLTFRRSCAHGVCGSDAMRINGKNRLACKSLIKDLNPSQPITVEPIKGLPVLKDLVVDMEPVPGHHRQRADPRAPAVPGGPRPLRRHHQVHPLRGVHHLVPGVLDRRSVLRPAGHRRRAPVHLRQP